MVYFNLVAAYNFIEPDAKPRHGFVVPAILAVLGVMFTLIYTTVYNNHTFFLLTYGVGVLYVIFKLFHLRGEPVIANMFKLG